MISSASHQSGCDVAVDDEPDETCTYAMHSGPATNAVLAPYFRPPRFSDGTTCTSGAVMALPRNTDAACLMYHVSQLAMSVAGPGSCRIPLHCQRHSRMRAPCALLHAAGCSRCRHPTVRSARFTFGASGALPQAVYRDLHYLLRVVLSIPRLCAERCCRVWGLLMPDDNLMCL